MAKRSIRLESDEILRKKSKVVEQFDGRLHELLDDMAETMYKSQGVGLAAVQVGILKRAITIDVGDGLMELINPEILETSGSIEDSEGCLSSPGEYGIVARPAMVKIKAQDRNGNWQEYTGTGLLARAFCHEIDHLDGILFKDLAKEMLVPEEPPRRRKLSLRAKRDS